MSDFALHLLDVFRQFGPIRIRKMFGGFGVYYDGHMIGLVSDETLYLKADDLSAHHFLTLGLTPFQYTRKGKLITLSYYRAPESVMDDCDEAARWAQRSFEAALRSHAAKAHRSARRR